MPIRTALLSVSDKTGLVRVRARARRARRRRILSSGGTAKALAAEGIPVETVESYTGSPEVMDGRVKTLHPRVHGGILVARRATTAAISSASAARAIDLVVVNLYPFEKTVGEPGVDARGDHREHRHRRPVDGALAPRRTTRASRSSAIRPTTTRVLAEIESDGRGLAGDARASSRPRRSRTRRRTTRAISGYLSAAARRGRQRARARIPRYLTLPFERAYGASLRREPAPDGRVLRRARRAAPGSLARAESLGAGGKELSFNNLVDVDAALEAVREFDEPAAVVVKHTNPCGVAVADDARERVPHGARGRRAQRVRRHRRAQPRGRRRDGEAPRRDVPRVRRRAVVRAGARSRCCARRRTCASSRPARGSPPTTRRSQYKRVGGGLVVQTRDATGGGRGDERQGRDEARADRRGAARRSSSRGASAST